MPSLDGLLATPVEAILPRAPTSPCVILWDLERRWEFSIAAEQLKWRRATSAPGRPQTNGAAAHTVRTVLEGSRSLLAASGLPCRWWNYAARRWCPMQIVASVIGVDPRHTSSALARLSRESRTCLVPRCTASSCWMIPSRAVARRRWRYRLLRVAPGGKWSKDYVALDLGTLIKNYDSKFIKAHRTGDARRKAGQPLFSFLALCT